MEAVEHAAARAVADGVRGTQELGARRAAGLVRDEPLVGGEDPRRAARLEDLSGAVDAGADMSEVAGAQAIADARRAVPPRAHLALAAVAEQHADPGDLRQQLHQLRVLGRARPRRERG